jgi:predicted nuclease of predicted toxin-antitoxin system
MKLLFDHNLSHKLVGRLSDIFPDSTQIRLLGMGTASDDSIWNYAKMEQFIVVSLDADFFDLSILRGQPPKLIWLRCGNSTVAEIERLLRNNSKQIVIFAADTSAGCLEIF